MSTPDYIWVVTDSFGAVRGTFCIKHEMIDWLKGLKDIRGWQVDRWKNGVYADTVRPRNFPLTELLLK